MFSSSTPVVGDVATSSELPSDHSTRTNRKPLSPSAISSCCTVMLAARKSPAENCCGGRPPTLQSTSVTTRATKADTETVTSVTLSAADGAVPERPPRYTLVLPGCLPAITSEFTLSTSAILGSATANVTNGVASRPSA